MSDIVTVDTVNNTRYITKNIFCSLLKTINDSLNGYLTNPYIATDLGVITYLSKEIEKNKIIISVMYKDKKYDINIHIKEVPYISMTLSIEDRIIKLKADIIVDSVDNENDYPVEFISLTGDKEDILSLLGINNTIAKEIGINDRGIRNDTVLVSLNNETFECSVIPLMYLGDMEIPTRGRSTLEAKEYLEKYGSITENDKVIERDSDKFNELMSILEDNAKKLGISVNDFITKYNDYTPKKEYKCIRKGYNIIKTKEVIQEFEDNDYIVLLDFIRSLVGNLERDNIVYTDKDNKVVEVSYQDTYFDNNILIHIDTDEIRVSTNISKIDRLGPLNGDLTTNVKEYVIPNVDSILEKYGYKSYIETIEKYFNDL